MFLLIILWVLAFLLQVYLRYIKDAIKFSVSQGNSRRDGIPLNLWPNNRFAFFKLTVFIFPFIPLIMTFLKYGFWTGIITGLLVSMVAYGLGRLWSISTFSRTRG